MDEETEVSDQELVEHKGGQILNVELLLSIFSSCPDHSA